MFPQNKITTNSSSTVPTFTLNVYLSHERHYSSFKKKVGKVRK